MGEIAEDMIDGTCCTLCGQYFVYKKKPEVLFTHGYPVACKDCYDPEDGPQLQSEEAETA